MLSELQLISVTVDSRQSSGIPEHNCLPEAVTEVISGTLTANNISRLSRSLPGVPLVVFCENALYLQYIKDAAEVTYGGTTENTTKYLTIYKAENAIKPGFSGTLYGNTAGVVPELFAGMTNYSYTEREQYYFVTDSLHRITGSLCNFQAPEEIHFSRDLFSALRKYNHNLAEVREFRHGRKIETTEDFKFLYSFLSERSNAHYCEKVYYDILTDLFIDYKELLK